MEQISIEKLLTMRESEDHVEFKEGKGGNFSYNGSSKRTPKDRRHCILGYVVALCNEGGGLFVLGIKDKPPHDVVGTSQFKDAIGKLESDIYRDKGIRTNVYELFTKDGQRVLVIQIPGRPIGKAYKFEDVPLMRVGDSLLPMDDKTYLSILQEQEPDFSEQICDGATLGDLDKDVINVMRQKYARKQDNPLFLALSDQQVLSDLKLSKGGLLTNAAVLLLGKKDFIESRFPHAKVFIEYRNSNPQINFDRRKQVSGPFFSLLDEVWNSINAVNGSLSLRDGPYVFDIPYYNEAVIREVVLNAFAHRDYRRNSEIVIKVFPNNIEVVNAGGFPQGVSLDNLLTVASTPRNRLIADVLQKVGLVERSGQGIDRIFFYSLAEGKAEPDYSRSDDFSVTVILSADIKDKGFVQFVKTMQNELPQNEGLSVNELRELARIRDGERRDLDKDLCKKLEDRQLVERHGKTRAQFYSLPRRYYEISGKIDEYSALVDWNPNKVFAVIAPFLKKYGKAKIADIRRIVGGQLSDKQLRSILNKLTSEHLITTSGTTNHTVYMLDERCMKNGEILSESLQIGIQTMKEKGILK